MAIKLEDKPNTVAPNADYPYGNIQDNTGSNNGTPVNTLVYADFHQFFAKMMAESGIVYNDQPDNATDGFQYWLALVEAIKNNCAFFDDISSSIILNGSITALTKSIKSFKNGFTRVIIQVTGSTTISANSNLATGFTVPIGTEMPIRAIVTVGGVNTGVDLILNSIGQLKNLTAISGSPYAITIQFVL